MVADQRLGGLFLAGGRLVRVHVCRVAGIDRGRVLTVLRLTRLARQSRFLACGCRSSRAGLVFDVRLRHANHVRPQDQVLAVHQDRVIAALNRRFAYLLPVLVERPRAALDPLLADFLDNLAVAVVDLTELQRPIGDAERQRRQGVGERFGAELGDRAARVDLERPVLRVTCPAAQVP